VGRDTTSGDDVEVGSTADGADGGMDMLMPVVGQQVTVPMVPVTESGWTYLISDEPLAENGVMRVSDTLDVVLALGEGYPTHFELELRQPYDVVCGGSFAGDPIDATVNVVEGETTPVLSVTQASNARIRMDVLEAGEGFFDVSVALPVPMNENNPACVERFAGIDRLDMTLRVNVSVRPVADVQVRHTGSCASRLTVFLAGTSLVGFETLIFDDRGESFVPSNASHLYPGTVHVAMMEEGTLTMVDSERLGLGAVRVDQAGEVSIRGLMGEQASSFAYRVDVVEVTQLESVEVDFEWVGLGYSSTLLSPDETHGVEGAAGLSNRVLPQLRSGSARALGFLVCSDIGEVAGVTASFFEMVSLTPETCQADNASTFVYSDKLTSTTHSLVGRSAEIIADGRCDLRLEAPDLNLGQGISAAVSATFVNVAEMEDSSEYPLCVDGEFALKCIQR